VYEAKRRTKRVWNQSEELQHHQNEKVLGGVKRGVRAPRGGKKSVQSTEHRELGSTTTGATTKKREEPEKEGKKKKKRKNRIAI
jgi:hypothetical protein